METSYTARKNDDRRGMTLRELREFVLITAGFPDDVMPRVTASWAGRIQRLDARTLRDVGPAMLAAEVGQVPAIGPDGVAHHVEVNASCLPDCPAGGGHVGNEDDPDMDRRPPAEYAAPSRNRT